MKKLSKFIYFIFAFALITCMAIFNPAITFASAAEEEDVTTSITISTSKIAKTVDASENQKLSIPMPNVTKAGVKKYIVVKDRSGNTYTYNCENGETKNQKDETVAYFKAFNSSDAEELDATKVAYIQPKVIGKGTYTIQYKVVDGNKTYYSDAQQVQVKGAAYEWEFAAENTEKNIIPSITNVGSSYILPLPKLVNNSKETESIQYTVEDLTTNITITKGGVDVTTAVTDLVENDTKVSYAFEEEGTYIIKYKSQVSAFPDRTYTVKVESNYNTKAELKVTHNSITNVQVGAETTFPTANVTDKTHNKSGIEANNVIKIKKGGELVATLEPNQYNYTFETSGVYTIYYEATDAYGNSATSSAYSITVSNKAPYLVTYAEDYTVTESDSDLDGVNDTVTVGEVETKADYLVKSEVGFGGFFLPAIYAEDYVTSYKDLEFTRKLELTTSSNESIWFDVDVSAADDAEHGNAALAAGQKGKPNQKIEFIFPEMLGISSKSETERDEIMKEVKKKYGNATFKLKYSAKGKDDTDAYATIYTIKVADVDALSYNVDKNMIINFPTINDSIDPNAELSFTAATAKEEPKSDELVADERVEVRTYYYYGAKSSVETALSSYITNVVKPGYKGEDKYNEKYGYQFDTFTTQAAYTALNAKKLTTKDGKTTIKSLKTELEAFKQDERPTTVTVFAVAINDQGQFMIKAQEIAIDNTNETGAPVVGDPEAYIPAQGNYKAQLAQIGDKVTKFNQNYEVYLPGISFTDTVDKSLEVEVRCYVDTPDQTVGVTIDEFIQSATGECGIKTARLTTTYAGTYYVVYTATDDAGNKATYVSTFEVANTEKAYIKVENGANLSKNVGEEVVFNLELGGNGVYSDAQYTVTWGENKPSGLGSQPNSYKFNKAGTYVATISATYTMNGKTGIKAEPSVTVTVTITEPKLEWASDINDVLTNRTIDLNKQVELPIISATENGVEINAVPKVVFIDKDNKETEVEVKFDETYFNGYYFTADKDGIYKVTYTATTDYNSESKSFTVTCGDYYDPTITIESNKLQDSTITYNGEDITFKVKSFKQETVNSVTQTGKYILTVVATENDEEIFSYDIKVTLNDTDAQKATALFTPDDYKFELTGDSVSNNGTNTWKITGVGSYELKLTIEDDNGNKDVKSITFKVVNKAEPKKVKDNVVGVVLIIVSAVILGGVILFFALAGKRNKTRKSAIRAAKKD